MDKHDNELLRYIIKINSKESNIKPDKISEDDIKYLTLTGAKLRLEFFKNNRSKLIRLIKNQFKIIRTMDFEVMEDDLYNSSYKLINKLDDYIIQLENIIENYENEEDYEKGII